MQQIFQASAPVNGWGRKFYPEQYLFARYTIYITTIRDLIKLNCPSLPLAETDQRESIQFSETLVIIELARIRVYPNLLLKDCLDLENNVWRYSAYRVRQPILQPYWYGTG
jgi:hypothetical protein